MGATVNILQSDEKCVQGNVILPFLMNSYSDLEDNQYVFSHSLKEKMDEVIIHFFGSIRRKRMLPKIKYFQFFFYSGTHKEYAESTAKWTQLAGVNNIQNLASLLFFP